MTQEILIQTCPHNDARVYHTRFELTAEQCIQTGPVHEVVSRFPGVVSVWVQRYSLQVAKSPAWTWEEVEPAVIEFLRNGNGI